MKNTCKTLSDLGQNEPNLSVEVGGKNKSAARKRVWEVDFLRGLMILCVVWDHTLNDIRVDAGGNYKTALFQALYDFSCKYSVSNIRAVCQPAIVILFIFAAGLSCSFSSNNFRRALKLMAVSVFLTLGGFVVSIVIKRHMIVYFNVIHDIALCVFLWCIIEWCWKYCRKNSQKVIFGVVMAAVIVTAFVVGACAKRQPWTDENSAWFFLVQHSGEKYSHFTAIDHRTFFPDFAWFLLGAFLGRALYKEKKTLFPCVNTKFVSPITFCGRKTLIIYFVSKMLTFGFIYLFHGILDLL